MSEPKYTYRLPPCGDHDVEAMESWLEDMAAKGLILSSDGFFMGFGSFLRQSPARIRYRLLPASKAPSIFDDSGPDRKQTDLMAEFGWDYIASRGNFLIYAATDPNAPEPDSDPVLQAQSLKAVVKESQGVVFSSLLSLAITICITMFGKLASFLIMMGPVWAGLFAGFIVWNFARKVLVWRHLAGVRKRLKSGVPLSHRADYEKGRIRHRIRQGLDIILTTGLAVMLLLLVFSSPIGGEKDVPMEEIGTLPFPTLQALFPDAEIVPEGHIESTVTHWENSISESFEVHQYADVRLPDGTSASAILSVRYHSTYPFLARALVWEAPSFGGFGNRRNMLDIRPEGVDYSLAWSDYRPKIAFCKGGVMMEATLSLYTDDGTVLLTPKDFAQIMADSVKGS